MELIVVPNKGKQIVVYMKTSRNDCINGHHIKYILLFLHNEKTYIRVNNKMPYCGDIMSGTLYYVCNGDNDGIYYPTMERAYHT